MRDFAACFPPDQSPIGVYIHVPFCEGRCHYCAFVTYPFASGSEEGYIAALEREIQLWSGVVLPQFDPCILGSDTLYFGGGTPSLFSPRNIAHIVEECRKTFKMVDGSEITIEINPGSVGISALKHLCEAGVNRVSLGIQSLEDHDLSAMGRSHTAAEALAAYKDLRAAGFQNVSVDLIAGFPGQTSKSMRTNLRKVLDLEPEHVSIYLLEIKPGTALESLICRGQIAVPDEDLAADLYEMICSEMTVAGYEQYEISNFAKPGRQCRHNLKYWQDGIFLGLGAGAHGMTGRYRYANLESVQEYERNLEDGKPLFASRSELTPEIRFKDALIMGMRLVKGVNLDLLSNRYCVDAKSFVMRDHW